MRERKRRMRHRERERKIRNTEAFPRHYCVLRQVCECCRSKCSHTAKAIGVRESTSNAVRCTAKRYVRGSGRQGGMEREVCVCLCA